jgi:type II secretory pathway pseudopilin PulG
MAFCAWCGNHVPQVSYAPCPRCGNPTNGAQRVAGAAGPGARSNTAAIVIGVVAGLFVLIAILGIIAAIAIPNFVNAQQRSKQKRTMSDIRSIATAAEAYATDKNEYPNGDLSSALAPTYIREVPRLDGWGTPFRYECWPGENATVCEHYAVGSAGGDKKWEREALRDYVEAKTPGYDCDIVFRDGTFLSYPENSLVGGHE